jgi:hypothetical protein
MTRASDGDGGAQPTEACAGGDSLKAETPAALGGVRDDSPEFAREGLCWREPCRQRWKI